MIELTKEQHHAVAAAAEFPPTVIDPLTSATYVLMPKEYYDRIKGMLEEDDARLMAPLLAELDAEDWEDAAIYEGNS